MLALDASQGVVTGVLAVMPVPADVRVHGGDMEEHHRNEKRLGRVLNKHQFSCVMYKATPEERRSEKPQLLFELEMRYCIRCNAQHWFIGDRIEFEQPVFDPNEYWTWQLEEMGFFDKAHESTAPND